MDILDKPLRKQRERQGIEREGQKNKKRQVTSASFLFDDTHKQGLGAIAAPARFTDRRVRFEGTAHNFNPAYVKFSKLILIVLYTVL